MGLRKRLESLAYAEKWLALGVAIGVAAGLFATGFYYLLGAVTMLAAEILGAAGPAAPAEVSDLSALIVKGMERWYLLPLVVALGAAASGVLVYTLAPEAEGHGTDAAIRAYHRRAAVIALRVPVIKAVASALTIGFGGSGGVEGPSVQMGGGIGSVIARALHLSPEDRRVALIAGVAGALAALFRAPLGAAVFAVEVLYKRDLEAGAVIPAIVAAIASYTVSAPFMGYVLLPSVKNVSIDQLYSANALASYLLLGIFVAPFAYTYAAAFQASHRAFRKIVESGGLPLIVKPVIGALLMGALALLVPHVAGAGRGLLAEVLEGEVSEEVFALPGLPLGLSLMVIAVAKIVATSLSIGSGGSGGVFAPALLSGALLGLSYYHLIGARLAPLDPRVYAYLGMASFFAAAAKVPLATSIMVGEMSGNYFLIPPTLMAAAVARELTGDRSIYESQVPRRPSREVVEAETLLALLLESAEKVEIKVRDLVDPTIKPVKDTETLSKAIEYMVERGGRALPVVDEQGYVEGVLDPEDLEEIIESLRGSVDVPLRNVRLRTPPVVPATATVDRALEEMVSRGVDYVVVVEEGGKYVGMVTTDEVAAALAYLVVHRKSRRSPRRTRPPRP